MRIGFLAPPSFGLGNRFSGVAQLARLSEQAVREILGHETVLLSPWEHVALSNLDLIHAFTASSSFIGGRTASAVPWALTPIHDSLMARAPYKLAVQCGRLPRVSTEPSNKRKLFGEVDQLIAMSSDEKSRINSHFGIPSAKISVVNCPAPTVEPLTASAVAQVLREMSVPPDNFALAICDYGARRKNIERLVRAAITSHVALVLAGNTSDTTELRSIKDLTKSTSLVTLLGPVSARQKAALMQGCAVYCQPSLEEGAGLAAMEAALLDRAVLATDVGGVRDHLGDHPFWADPKDVASITRALQAALGQGAGHLKSYVEQRHSLDSFAKDLDTAYAKCLAPTKGSGRL